jgi:hypothetical protein
MLNGYLVLVLELGLNYFKRLLKINIALEELQQMGQ